MDSEVPILFNQTINKNNYLDQAERYIAETTALFASTHWGNGKERKGVTLSTTDFSFAKATDQDTKMGLAVPTIKASIRVNAPRETVFPLVSQPERAAEWEPTDTGYQWVNRFDDNHGIYSATNRFPLLGERYSLLFGVKRAELTATSSLYTIRAVEYEGETLMTERRLYQQVFAWLVEDLPNDGCRLTTITSAPEGMLPFWLFKLISPPGWVSILSNIKLICEGEIK